MTDQIIKNLRSELEGVIEFFNGELKNIRTGRATPSILDGVNADYYGVKTPISQIASINALDSKTLEIAPWDKSQLQDIEKSINESDLSLTPNNNGEVIRIALPPMTEERRDELVKVLGKKAEEARIKVRQFREDAITEVQSREKQGDISEDDRFRAKEEIQKVVDEFNKKIEEIEKKKEEDIKEV